jgi:hypothetical protein
MAEYIALNLTAVFNRCYFYMKQMSGAMIGKLCLIWEGDCRRVVNYLFIKCNKEFTSKPRHLMNLGKYFAKFKIIDM